MDVAAGNLYEEIVDALAAMHRSRPGHRAVHAKGTLLAGTFTASARAAQLSRAAHFAGEPVRATVRFSNGSGSPDASDAEPDARGIAMKLYLPDGSTTDLLGITLPVFFVRTPEDFLEFVRARRPDPETGKPDVARVGAFLKSHPEAMPAIQAALGAPPAESFARLRYFGLHAYRLVAAAGEPRLVRFRWEPEAGVGALDPEAAKAAGHDYLMREVLERAQREGVRMRLVGQLGEDGDPADDPTAAWPEERELAELGTLELTGPETERETGDDVLVFDPMRTTDGVEPSDDRILRARPHAYAVSVERRTGVRRA